jgi:outer membrane lipoprotein-sorting protein
MLKVNVIKLKNGAHMNIASTSPLRKQEGMGHVIVAVVILVVLAVIGFAGYRVVGSHNKKASTTTTKTTTSSESQASTSGCEATYHDANLCKFAVHASLDKVAYKATITGTDADGTASTMTLLSDGKGNTSLSGTGNGASFDSIQLGGKSYIKNGDVWYEYPAGDTSTPTEANPAANMNLVLGAGVTYKPLGKESCDGKTCFKYQVTEAATPNATQFAWFDDSSYMLRKWKYTDPSSGSMEMIITYQSVNITKPSPVQSLTQ